MELPTDIWEMIVKQSREPIEDKVKDLSVNQLATLMTNLSVMKQKKLKDKWDNFPLYTIIADEDGETYMVCKKNSSNKKYILLRRMDYIKDYNEFSFFGSYWFCDQNTYRNTAIMNLETDKIVFQTINYIQPNDLDYDCFRYLPDDYFGMRNFIKIIQKQEDIDNERIENANMLRPEMIFAFIDGRTSELGDCFFVKEDFNVRKITKVVRTTDQYISYEAENNGVSIIKRVHKKYVVVSF